MPNENDFRMEDEWNKKLESLYQSIQEEKHDLKKELENLNRILSDLKAGK